MVSVTHTQGIMSEEFKAERQRERGRREAQNLCAGRVLQSPESNELDRTL